MTCMQSLSLKKKKPQHYAASAVKHAIFKVSFTRHLMFMKRSDQCTQTQYKEEVQASRLHLKNKNVWEF